jgi:hypothetical protein
MAVTSAQVASDGATVVAATMNLTSVPASSTPLYVCYSATGPSGPFVASSAGLLTVGAPKPVATTPSAGVTSCDLPNITVTGAYCLEAPNATLAFSMDPACPLASLMAVTTATIAADGQSITATNVDLSTVTTPTSLYACYSPTGPDGPFYPSDSVVLTMGDREVTAIAPPEVVEGCKYVAAIPQCWTAWALADAFAAQDVFFLTVD